MQQLYFQVDEKWVPVENDETVLQAALRAEIPHTHICGGNARCSTCRVMINEGLENCNPRNNREQLLADKLQFSANIRLACQTTINGTGIKLRRLVRDEQDLQLTSQFSLNHLDKVGVEKFVVVLFADLRGFTAFTEAVPAYDALHLLNRYYQQASEMIRHHGGYIDNYMGDGIMALFEVENDSAARSVVIQAVEAGLEIVEGIGNLNEYLKGIYAKKLDIGVGIHYGEAIVGQVGGASYKKVTAIGDAVNLTSRIEQANKEVNTQLLVSETVYEQVKDSFFVGKECSLSIKGKSGSYKLYELHRNKNIT